MPMAKAVRPWVEGVKGKLIRYKVPIAEKSRVPGGPTHYERPTSSIKTSWNRVHVVPLSPAAVAVLRRCWPLRASDDVLCSRRRGQSRSAT